MVTKLKNISHLFLTRRQKIREARAVQPEKESPPLYTVLIAGLAGNGASSGFSSSLAKALCKKVSSVFLFNAGHDVIKSALIMRYVHSGAGTDHVETVTENFCLGEQFEGIHENLTGDNLMLINDARLDGHDLPADYLDMTGALILLITPDTDAERVCDLAAYVLRRKPAVTVHVCVTETDSSAEAAALFTDLDQRFKEKMAEAPLHYLGQAPSSAAPQQVVMGGRIINLARPEVMQATENQFHQIAESLLASRADNSSAQPSYEVLHLLQNLLVQSYPQMFMNK